jgi:hypothetical protein
MHIGLDTYQSTRKNLFFSALIAIMAFYGMCPIAMAEHRHTTPSAAAVQPVSGGQSFAIANPSDKVFAAVVRHINLSNTYTIESANKETGMILTAMTISGGAWTKTGRRIVITVIEDTNNSSIVRVAITDQQVHNGAGYAPIGVAKVDDAASKKLAEELQPALIAELSKAN